MIEERNRHRKLSGAALASCAALGALLWTSCMVQHEAPSASDTATSWLSSCWRNSDCADSNVCIQAVCTVSCRPQDRSPCQGLHALAQCEAPRAGVPICDLPCTRNAECDAFHSGYVCAEGHCREPAGAATAPPELPTEAGGADAAQEVPVAEAGPAPSVPDAAAPLAPEAGPDGSILRLLSDDPGCTTDAPPQTQYASREELAALLVGKWAPCLPRQYEDDEREGLEFLANGDGYDLSYVEGAYVRKPGVWKWEVSPAGWPSAIPFSIKEIGTNAPRITLSPRSMTVAVDPTAPRFVPIQ